LLVSWLCGGWEGLVTDFLDFSILFRNGCFGAFLPNFQHKKFKFPSFISKLSKSSQNVAFPEKKKIAAPSLK
jgi:hypothetical protein